MGSIDDDLPVSQIGLDSFTVCIKLHSVQFNVNGFLSHLARPCSNLIWIVLIESSRIQLIAHSLRKLPISKLRSVLLKLLISPGEITWAQKQVRKIYIDGGMKVDICSILWPVPIQSRNEVHHHMSKSSILLSRCQISCSCLRGMDPAFEALLTEVTMQYLTSSFPCAALTATVVFT